MRDTSVALVLSGGGLFGAYQAGAWSVLEEFVQPAIVIGASVGCLNGWAIAGGCPPEELVRRWIDLAHETPHARLRLPASLADGLLDSAPLERWIQGLWRDFRPITPFGVVLTRARGLAPELFHWPEIGWEHLAASCAVPGFLRQYRIGGEVYLDGGLLGSLPMWAAEAAGAGRAIGINLLPRPMLPMRWVAPHLRRLSRAPRRLASLPSVVVAPNPPLGGALAMAVHRPRRIAEWIERGRHDARRSRPAIEALIGAQ